MDLETDHGPEPVDPGTASWEAVKDVLDRALDLPRDQRAAFLTEACGEDSPLRREVESLLAAEAGLGDFLDEPIFSLHGDFTDGEDPNLGRLVGPYRLLSRLGRGGMGSVYLAERADGQFEQKVAIKLIKRGMDTDEILRRFHIERRILAGLVDDHIARLYDGGSTDDGLPYFVMEYVEGEPIDEYCDARRLGIGERLALFLTVCRAVHGAHQSLVVHRDLKPANILVTADGVPKLLDFGIAKLLTRDDGDDPAPTVLAELPMTPGYASPEQVRGEAITTASDVYSLGVLLYELLTGARPYDADTLRPDLWAKLICEEDPPKPSTAVRRQREVRLPDGNTETLSPESVAALRAGDPRRLGRRLSGDLDNIVMTALAKDPRRRYGSAEQLAEDVRRYLEGLPVRARRPTVPYRAGKFIRRHAWGVGVAVVTAAALVAIAGTMTVERSRTAAERDRAREVIRFLVNVFGASQPSQAKGETITAREILRDGVRRVDDELADQPLTQATLKDAMGQIYFNLGFNAQARALLEEALEQRERLQGPDHPDVAVTAEYLALALRDGGDLAGAERLLRRSIGILEEHRTDQGGDVSLANVLHDLASLLIEKGEYDQATRLFDRALAIQRRHTDRVGRAALALTLNSYATMLYHRGELDRAEVLNREVLAIRRELYGDLHPEISTALNNLASTLLEKEDYEEAGALFSEDLAMRRKLYGDADTRVALTLNNLAGLRQVQGDLAAAEPLIRESLAIVRRNRGDDHPNVAVVRRNLASLLAARGDAAGCEAEARPALEVLRRAFGPDHWRVADAESVLGGCLVGLGRYAEAEPLLVRGYEIVRKAQGDAKSYTRDARARLAALYRAWGKPDLATRYETAPGAPAPG